MRCGVFLMLAAMRAWCAGPDCGLVPGWTPQGPPRQFVAENLFEYMNGNAEGYLLYTFVRMEGVTCKQAGDTIVIDISEMSSPEFAYGMFTANRDPKQPVEKLGMAGQIVPRKAIFVKDRYYVELSANPAKDHTAALRLFASELEKRLPGRTDVPEALAWFPAERLVPDSARLVPESVLGIRLLKRGYVAQYEFGKAFVVSEATPEAAADLMAKWRARLGKSDMLKLADDGFHATDRYLGRLCVFRKGRYVAGYAGLAAGEDDVALASALAARLP